MKSKRLTWTLAFAFCLLTGIIIGVGVAGLRQLSQMNEQTRDVTDVRWPKVELARQALYFLDLNDRLTLELFMAADNQRVTELLRQREENASKIATIIAQIQAKAVTADEKARLARLVASGKEYDDSYRTAVDRLTNKGDPDAARELATERTLPKMIAHYNQWTDFVADQGREMDLTAASVGVNFRAARQRVAGLIAAAVLVAVGVAWFVTRRLGQEIDNRNRAEDQLRHAHEGLEQRVRERTAELRQAQQQLLESSRLAGMSEVATGILHNVGNVLNSVTISANVIADKIGQSPVNNLCRAADMIDARRDDLGSFLTDDPKGKKIPAFFSAAAKLLREENNALTSELSALTSGIDHIKQIVQFQMGQTTVSTVRAPVEAHSIFEEAVTISLSSPERHGITVLREIENVGVAEVDKHKILQILINLITNAKNAVKEAVGNTDPKVTLRLTKSHADGAAVLLYEVIDNGTGIAPENLARVFNHGFTTRAKGHGFGLHSAANAATEMGGSLGVASDGLGTGARFTLRVPFVPVTSGKSAAAGIAA